MPKALLGSLDMVGYWSRVEREMKEMKLRVGEERLLKQLAMQIFNGEDALAPPRALRPPLLRDLFDASGKLCVFPEDHAGRL
jgi:hypothetical protein